MSENRPIADMSHQPYKSSSPITVDFFQSPVNVFLLQIGFGSIYGSAVFVLFTSKRQRRFQSVFFFSFVSLSFSFVVVDHVHHFFLSVHVRNQLCREVFRVFEQVQQNFLYAYLDGSLQTFLELMNVENLLFGEQKPARSENIAFSSHFGYFLFSIHFLGEPERSRVEGEGEQVLLLPLFHVELHFCPFHLRLPGELVLGYLSRFFLLFSQVQVFS